MRRPGAGYAQVVAGRDDAFAEEPLPDAVDLRANQECVRGRALIGQPARQRQTPAAGSAMGFEVRQLGSLGWTKHLDAAERNLFAGPSVIAAPQKVRRRRRSRVVKRAQRTEATLLSIQFLDFAL